MTKTEKLWVVITVVWVIVVFGSIRAVVPKVDQNLFMVVLLVLPIVIGWGRHWVRKSRG